jgi:hypothetical protein
VRTGTGLMHGIPVALGVMDFGFMGGSMGSVSSLSHKRSQANPPKAAHWPSSYGPYDWGTPAAASPKHG